MIRWKQTSIWVMVSLLVLLLASCGGGSNGNNGASGDTANNGGNKSNASQETDSGVDTSKFVKISYLVLGDKPKNGQFEKVLTEVNKIMKEKSTPSWSGNGSNGRIGRPNTIWR